MRMRYEQTIINYLIYFIVIISIYYLLFISLDTESLIYIYYIDSCYFQNSECMRLYKLELLISIVFF